MQHPIFVIQKHWASTLHFDLRLQIGRVLKSWVVPKGPPLKVGDKRLAILTQDHTLSYAIFEGEIPKGKYGAGRVKIWDSGTIENRRSKGLSSCFKEGVIEVQMVGKKLKGTYALVELKNRDRQWLFMKVKKKG